MSLSVVTNGPADASEVAYPVIVFDLRLVPVLSGEKRKLPEALTLEDAKRIRVMGDIPMELVNEVMMTITDPAAMLGPEASRTMSGHLMCLKDILLLTVCL